MKVNDNKLYVCIAGFDTGDGFDLMSCIWLLSKEKPKKELVEEYLNRTCYRMSKVNSIRKFVPTSYFNDMSLLQVEEDDAINWVNDLDEMTRRAYNEDPLCIYRIEEDELNRIP